jgi:ferritin-like metal-binding protein YciE
VIATAFSYTVESHSYEVISMAENTVSDIVKRYLKDAIAAESSFQSQLEGFAKEGDDPTARDLFQRHARETRVQRERLEARLHELGDSPSSVKSFMAHMFNFAPKSSWSRRSGTHDTEPDDRLCG